MPIAKIKQIRQPGVFRDFNWASDLPDFAKYNLIFGWNGTGKTTISRLLRHLETKRSPEHGSAIFNIDGRDLNTGDFRNSNLTIKVFNIDYVDANVHRSDGTNIPPIFVLGETGANQQRELRRKQLRLTTVIERLAEKDEHLRRSSRELNQHESAVAKIIKDNLSSNTYPDYNTYDRRKYVARVISMIQTMDTSERVLTDDQRVEAREQFSSRHLDRVDIVQLSSLGLSGHNETIQRLLNQSVLNTAIDSLQEDGRLSTWVRDGLNIHEQRTVDSCLFCGQNLPEDRLMNLRSHFNDAFNELMTELDNEIEQLNTIVQNLQSLSKPDAGRLYPNLTTLYDEATNDLNNAIEQVVTQIERAKTDLQNKKQNMFDSVNRETNLVQFNDPALSTLNEVLERHNAISDSHIDEVGQSAEMLEADWVANNLPTYVVATNAVQQARTERDNLLEEKSILETDIPRLQSQLIDHRRPADEFNLELSAYLGYDELQLQAEDTGYTIVRNGQTADGISEGEKTAIALIYFLKSLQNVDHDVTETIVVIDDPISSLDSNALYAAYGMIRERCQKALQLFLLTHNFVFFREFRDWFKTDNEFADPNTANPAEFYMLKREFDEAGRKSVISHLDPLLKNFGSDYHYLFWYVFETANLDSNTNLQAFYPLPNITRRLLEMFLAFKFPHLTEGIGASLAEAGIQPHIRRQIMRYVDAFSHGDAISSPGHDPTLLAQTPIVLSAVLDAIKEIDTDHYRRMRRVVVRQHNQQN